jgi:hypothetical protein
MSWQAILDARRWLLQPGPPGQGVLARGTLLVEAHLPAFPDMPVPLLSYRRSSGWDRALTLAFEPPGRLVFESVQGPTRTRAVLDCPLPEAETAIRVLYAWDAPRRCARLALELPERSHWTKTPVRDPHPLPLDDLARLAEAAGARRLVAWSDGIEPIGPMPGLAAGTPVETAAGLRAVEEIRPGDLVRTTEHGFQPVRQTFTRRTPAAGHFAPILLAAPAFGLLGDALVSPDHRMLIAGADAEYLFGTDAVLVEARHLAPLASVRLGHRHAVIDYFQLVLDRHACLSIAGAWGESQFLGDLRDRPGALAGTALAHVSPAQLPRHEQAANPMLQPYEAVVLVSAIRA